MKKNFCSLGHIQMALGLTLLVSGVAIGQMRVVTGTVTDQGKPVSGVSVFQKGSDAVTMTNESGVYRMQVSGENPSLVFRHPEFGERTVFLGSKITINVSFGNGEREIEEVVLNAGYYKVKERESTGSIAKITSKEIENQPVNNALAAMQGRLAGVNIIQGSGIAGGGFDIQIRGRNSLRNNSNGAIDANVPLYIIDGVPVSAVNEFKSNQTTSILPYQDSNPLNAINPDDIESIEVLKDADATAIYGSKGANGVVLVATKKGRSGKTEVLINNAYGLGTAPRLPKMMNLSQYLQVRRDAFANDGITQYPATAFDVNGTWDLNKETDWQRYFIGNTSERSTSRVQISGGSRNTRFMISGGHDEETTTFPGSYRYKRNTFGANLNHETENKKLRVSWSAYYTQQNNVLPPTDFSRVYRLAPNAPDLFSPDGSINWANKTFANPMAEASQVYKPKGEQLLSNLNLSYSITKDLQISLNGGYSRNTTEEKRLYPKTFYNPEFNIGSERSALSIATPQQSNWILEPQLNYNTQWGKHKIDVLIGGTFQDQSTENKVLNASNFPSDDLIEDISSAAALKVTSSGSSIYRYQAVYGRLNYQFNSRYILNVTGRRDGSSRFGDNRRYANFSALGAAWLFSKEGFLQDVSWLSFGKLRFSYGSAGSDLIGNYQFYDTYLIASTIYDGTSGMNPSRLYNPNFSWEKTLKLEAALEVGLFKDRINLVINRYRNRSSDQLVGVPLSTVTGFTSYQGNMAATVENSGWEFSLQSQNIKSKDFSWESSFNLSLPKNKLISFPNLESSTYASSLMVGYSTNIRKYYHYLGVDPITGLYQFEDKNGDGKLDVNDRTVIKEIGPLWFGGVTNNLRYKGFELSVLLQFSRQSQFNQLSMARLLGNMGNLPAEFLDYWTPDNPNAKYQRPTTGANPVATAAANNYLNSDASVSDIFAMKLKNVSLRYNIPNGLLGTLRASVYLEGQNILTVSNFKGSDPDYILADFLPPLRVISIGTTIKF